ncbi:hypothetical protein FH972_023076 [Carpinus fangiana]|uniref:Uncharacterized protein n=1 Tax=Carpinus fangiana TaxID=176857 RepID=A0A5N6KUF2_9ROSI|nr:hypothetical protein FH972_023076 [Carpinus fangiana]
MARCKAGTPLVVELEALVGLRALFATSTVEGFCCAGRRTEGRWGEELREECGEGARLGVLSASRAEREAAGLLLAAGPTWLEWVCRSPFVEGVSAGMVRHCRASKSRTSGGRKTMWRRERARTASWQKVGGADSRTAAGKVSRDGGGSRRMEKK